MKPSKIYTVMDLAREAVKRGHRYNPLFAGPPGLGKSEIVQAWCKENGYDFVDLRAAYLEAPDLIGFPSIELVNGKRVTCHNTPEFWPQDPEWKGVILLDEVNRGTTSVMNTMMQLLTDRKVHNYVLPKGAIIVGCINPEDSNNDVNAMDSALKDRFQTFDVGYDKKDFVKFTKERNWDKSIPQFIESGAWTFTNPENMGNVVGSKYVSPRTWSKVNAVLDSAQIINLSKDDEILFLTTELGRNVGRDFYNFRHDEAPVLYGDLVTSKKAALKKLAVYSDVKNLKNGMLAITIQDIVENKEITDELLVEVLQVIPVDLGTTLIKDLEYAKNDKTILQRLCKDHPEIKALFKSVLNYGK